MAHAASPDRAWDASRGREARAPREIPARGWRDILWRVKERISADNLSIISAGVAFYALLAIFPALIALVGLYGLVFDPQQVTQHLSALTAVLPAEAANLIGTQLKEVTSMAPTSLGVGSIVLPGSPDWERLRGQFPGQPGDRAIIHVDVGRISDSCGFGVPRYDFVEERDALPRWSEVKGPEGLARYQRDRNTRSIDGLPSLEAAE